MEFVLVVPRRELFPGTSPQGFLPFTGAGERAQLAELIAQHGFFVERPYAERTPELKQIIPYALVGRGPAARRELFLLRRTARGGDARLHHKLSVGVGGHVNPCDALGPDGARLADPLPAGIRRELAEELVLGPHDDPCPLGLINDDSNEVGAVHVGLVLMLEARGPVAVREADVLEGDFQPVAELRRQAAEGANFETWSRLLLERPDLFEPPAASLPRDVAASSPLPWNQPL